MKKLIIAVLCSSALSVLAMMAWIALSQDAKPAASGDRSLSIPACAFSEMSNDYDFFRSTTLYNESSYGYYHAAVYLPHGSIMKKIKLICLDNNPGSTSKFTLHLERADLSGTQSPIAHVSSTGADPNHRIFSEFTTAGKKYVNNHKYQYWFWLDVPTADSASNKFRFLGAKVVYAPPSP